MDLSPTRSVTSYDDTPWVGSRHGTDADRSGTLDVATFRTASQVDANGFIPSGVPVKFNSTSKLYEFCATGTRCSGHIAEQVKVNPASTRAGFARRWHGVVIVAELPVATFVPSTDGTPGIEYV